MSIKVLGNIHNDQVSKTIEKRHPRRYGHRICADCNTNLNRLFGSDVGDGGLGFQLI